MCIFGDIGVVMGWNGISSIFGWLFDELYSTYGKGWTGYLLDKGCAGLEALAGIEPPCHLG
jgi:hypothetical protein